MLTFMKLKKKFKFLKAHTTNLMTEFQHSVGYYDSLSETQVCENSEIKFGALNVISWRKIISFCKDLVEKT